MATARAQMGKNGFTLMELLISIAIFAVVISSVYGAYRVTFQTVSSAEKQSLADVAGRIILERISDDLAVLAIDDDGLLKGQRGDGPDGRADSLECIAYAHLDFSREEKSGGRARIGYRVVENENGHLDLYRSDTLALPGDDEGAARRGELLARDLLSFQLTYVTGDGTETEEWNSRPEGETPEGGPQGIDLPALIRVEIVLTESAEDKAGIYLRTSVAPPVPPSAEEEAGG